MSNTDTQKTSAQTTPTQQPAWAERNRTGGPLPAPPGAVPPTGGPTPAPPQLNPNLPAWAQPGSNQYNNLNTLLQTMPMRTAVDMFKNGGIGQTGRDAIGQFGDIYNRAGQPGAAETYLSDMASGSMIGNNPYLDSIVNKSSQQIGDQVNQMFAAGGRYGSGANQGVLADSIASNANNLYNDDYQRSRDRQISAASAIQGAQNAGLSTQLAATQGGANVENQGTQNLLGMIGQLPTIQGNKTFDSTQQMKVGNMLDQYTQTGLNDLIKQWTQQDMEPWARLGGLISAATGVAGPWGTISGTSKTSQGANPFQLLGLLGSIPFGGFGAPFSAGTFGGTGGLLGGLY
jgi:hypothetical protein